MAATKPNVENLPLNIDGKIEMVPRRQYANHKAQSLSIKHKNDIKKGQVSDMIDMIVAGKELEEGNEEVWYAVYNEIKEDIDLAQDKIEELLEEQRKKDEEKKQAEEEAKQAEQRLVMVATNTDVTATFATLGEKFDLGSMDRCVAKDGVTDEDLMSALVTGIKMDNFSNWAKGDLVAQLEDRGHVNAMVTLCEQTGIPYKSIYRMAVTARNVPPENRLPGVSFTTYAEVANARFSKDDKKNQEILEDVISRVGTKVEGDSDDAKKQNEGIITTAQDARKAVQAAQGKVTPQRDPNAVDLDKDTFIVVEHSTETVQVATGFPKAIAGTDGVVIVHVKTSRMCYDAEGKSWTPLDKYVAPEVEPAPAAEPEKPAPAPAKAAAPAAAKPAKGAKASKATPAATAKSTAVSGKNRR